MLKSKQKPTPWFIFCLFAVAMLACNTPTIGSMTATPSEEPTAEAITPPTEAPPELTATQTVLPPTPTIAGIPGNPSNPEPDHDEPSQDELEEDINNSVEEALESIAETDKTIDEAAEDGQLTPEEEQIITEEVEATNAAIAETQRLIDLYQSVYGLEEAEILAELAQIEAALRDANGRLAEVVVILTVASQADPFVLERILAEADMAQASADEASTRLVALQAAVLARQIEDYGRTVSEALADSQIDATELTEIEQQSERLSANLRASGADELAEQVEETTRDVATGDFAAIQADLSILAEQFDGLDFSEFDIDLSEFEIPEFSLPTLE